MRVPTTGILPAALAAFAAAAENWKPVPGDLMTRWAARVDPANPLPEYPRPQLVRKEWTSLNGLWSYALTAKDAARPEKLDGQILVPFPIESALSGVKKELKPDQRLWYRRTFTAPPQWKDRRVLLHFGAVDWQTTVFLNGRELGGHRGGYDGFTFDIAKALKPGEMQELVVSVWDPTDAGWQLRGKQTLLPVLRRNLP